MKDNTSALGCLLELGVGVVLFATIGGLLWLFWMNL